MFCALLMSRYQVSVYRTNGPLVLNYLPLKIWTLKCSLNSLTLQFCRYEVSALPTLVLNLATFMYKHLLGA